MKMSNNSRELRYYPLPLLVCNYVVHLGYQIAMSYMASKQLPMWIYKINHFEISDMFLSDALEILGLRSPVYDWDTPV